MVTAVSLCRSEDLAREVGKQLNVLAEISPFPLSRPSAPLIDGDANADWGQCARRWIEGYEVLV